MPDKRVQPQHRGYDTGWRKARIEALKRYDFICQRCGRRAVMVHHMDEHPDNNDQSNLQPLCRACHEKHHGRKR
jgi:5-methylcytosine-specific restriction endonuclease McrA